MKGRPGPVAAAAAVFALAALAGIAVGLQAADMDVETVATARPPSGKARVVRVVDGDTIVLDGLGSSRIIGVDTPETKHGPVECWGPQADAYTRRRLQGRTVLWRLGRERRDRYGRPLVYLRVSGRQFAVDLARQGHATQLTIRPNTTLASRIAAAVAYARARNRGGWGACHPFNPRRTP